jgi:mono/diheme cytochrome c family protein
MKKQPKYLPYQQNSFFEDQRAMRPLVSGTVPRGRPAEAVNSGRTPQGELLTRIPAAISAASLETGRQRFNVICAACHGTLGDGNSIPARKMSLRPPPSLHIFKNRRDGFFYQEISLGYGFMPSFAHLLTPEERWDVVAYVRALQLSQSIRLDQAPAAVQQELEKTR